MSQQTYYANPDNLIARADLVPNSLDKLNSTKINPFIKYNQLAARFNNLAAEQTFIIGELNFAYGLNFLATLELWNNIKLNTKHTASLHYISFLPQPISPNDLTQFFKNAMPANETTTELLRQYNLLLPGYHRLSFKHNLELTLIIGRENASLTELNTKFDAWYLNGTSYCGANLELLPATCNELARLSNAEQLTSWVLQAADNSTALSNLNTAGFVAHNQPKQHTNDTIFSGYYQESNTATTMKSRHKPTYYTRHPVLPLQNKHITIIGAGISGAATALSLAKRGYQVTVYEKNSAPALEASGNYQGMLYASWSAFGGTMMELSCNAYRYTHNLITSQLQLNTDYAPCGLIQLGHSAEQIRRNSQLLNANLPPDFLSVVNHQQIEQLAGVKLDTTLTGVYYPSGLWLNPPSLIKALLQHPNISLITNCQIQAIEYQEKEWQLFDDKQAQIASTPCLVLCNSHYINQFKPTANLQIRKIRGQISIVPQQNKLQTILCGTGYITPNKATKFTLGATFQFNDHSTAVRTQDHQLNLANFAQILPDIIGMVDCEQLEGQTNFRASPHDYLPLVGPIAKYAEFVEDYAKLRQDKKARISPICQCHPSLYLNLGHGAKGMLTAPFCGELIADYIAGTPLACSESLRQAIHPNRLYVHELVHRSTSQEKKHQLQ